MKTYCKLFFITCASMFLLSSCVDDNYDLSKLPDNIIIASDSMILPIGYSDSVTAREMIDDQHFDFLQVRDGMYFVNYSDSILLNMSQDKKIDDIIENSSTRIFASDKLINTDIVLNNDEHAFLTDSIQYHIRIGNTLKRLDYIRFRQGAGCSRMNLIFSTKDVHVVSGNVTLTVRLKIPNGVTLVPDVGSIQLINGEYVYEIKDIQVKNMPLMRSFSVISYERTSSIDPVFKYETDLYMSAGSVVRYSNPVPSYSCNMSSENMYGDFVRGQVSYSSTVKGLSIDLKNLYKNFDPNLDRFRLYHPRLFVTSRSDAGIPLHVLLRVKSDLATYSPIDLGNLVVSADTSVFVDNKFMFSNNVASLNVPDGFTWKEFDMRGLINQRPTLISSELDCSVTENTGTVSAPHFMSARSKAMVKYNLEMPVSFDEDFKLSYSDTLIDVLNDDRVKETFFSSGSADITATLLTTIPLNWTVQLIILSSNPSEAPVVIPQLIQISGANGRSETNFRVTLTADQMKYMDSPAHVKVVASVTSDSNLKGVPIRNSDFFQLKNIRLIKKGGISVR